MKLTISISAKEVKLFKNLANKVRNQIVNPIKGQILTLMGKPESKEKEPVKARIREFYENSLIITTEKWDNGFNGTIEIKSSFIEKVANLVSNLIDEAAPSIGAFSGAMMIFMGFINSTTSKIKSFIEKIKEEEEEGSTYTNNVFFPDESTVVNALIRKNKFSSTNHIGWVIESSKKLSFEEELRLVEMVEIAIEKSDFSQLNHHFIAASFDNKEDAERWFRDHNKISTMFNVVKHLDGWTVKDWREEEEKKEEEEDKNNEEDIKEKIEYLLKNLIYRFDRFKTDQSEENLLGLKEGYDAAHEYWADMSMEDFEKMCSIKMEANRIIPDPKNWIGW